MGDFLSYIVIPHVVLFAANMADWWTTERALSRGGTEANKIVEWMMRTFGDMWIICKVGVTHALALSLPIYAGFYSYVSGTDVSGLAGGAIVALLMAMAFFMASIWNWRLYK